MSAGELAFGPEPSGSPSGTAATPSSATSPSTCLTVW